MYNIIIICTSGLGHKSLSHLWTIYLDTEPFFKEETRIQGLDPSIIKYDKRLGVDATELLWFPCRAPHSVINFLDSSLTEFRYLNASLYGLIHVSTLLIDCTHITYTEQCNVFHIHDTTLLTIYKSRNVFTPVQFEYTAYLFSC